MKSRFLAALILFFGSATMPLWLAEPAQAQQTGAITVVCANEAGVSKEFRVGWDNTTSFFEGKGNIAALFCQIGSGGWKTFISTTAPESTWYYNGIAPIPVLPVLSDTPTVESTPQPTPTQSPSPEPTQSNPTPAPSPSIETTTPPTPEPSQSPTPQESPTTNPETSTAPSVDTVTVINDTATVIGAIETTTVTAEPKPEPKPEPQPAPPLVVEPAPAPRPEPTPEPLPAPQIEPEPVPAPDSQVEPAPAPAPEPEAQPAPAPEPAPEPQPESQPEPVPEPQPAPEIAPEPAPEPPTVAPEPEVEPPAIQIIGGVIPNSPDQLPEKEPKLPEPEKLVAHVQQDKAGVENGGIEFFGTKSQPQVIGEDGQLTPPPPAPGSGDPIPPDAITTADTFIGQAGGVTFNSPDIAVPVPAIEINIDIPGVGETAQAIADAYVALANIGNDMSPITRKKAKKIIVTTIMGGAILRRMK